MVLIREACRKLGTKDLTRCILICSAEPCHMCTSAFILSGIRDFYYGANMEPFCNPYIRCRDVMKLAKGDITLVEGILEKECRAVVQEGRNR